MSELQPLISFDSCKQWLEGFNNPSTHKIYPLQLQLFCRFSSTTPDNLLKKTPTEIKTMVINYVIHLKKVAKPGAGKPKRGEICVNSVHQYVKGVKHFLEFHEVALPWKKIAWFFPEQVTSELVPPTDDQVNKLLAVADIWDRVVILMERSSGIRRGVLALPMPLKFKQITKLPNGIGVGFAYGESKRGRKPIRLNPETMQAIDSLKEWRLTQGEKITGESFIIRDKFAPMSKLTNKPSAVKADTLTRRMERLYLKAGISLDNIQPNHGFRKVFSTKVRAAGVDKDVKRLLMGQSSELDDIYDNIDDPQYQEMLTREYEKAVDILTIDDTHRLKVKLKTAEIKNTELEGKYDKLIHWARKSGADI